MYSRRQAGETPDQAAFIMATGGETVTYRQLDERANQVANFFASAGLGSAPTRNGV